MSIDGDYSVSPSVHNRGFGSVNYGGDERLFVEFYDGTIELGAESRKAGRKIFKNVPHVRIIEPGDRLDVKEFPLKFDSPEAEEEGFDRGGYIQRFPRQWAAYKKKESTSHQGTPIELWPNPNLDRARCAELKAQNIHTVEQLAGVTDTNLANLGMGARELREQAKAWLKAAEDSAALNQMAAQNQELKDEIEALKQQFKELAGEEAKPKRTRRSAKKTEE